MTSLRKLVVSLVCAVAAMPEAAQAQALQKYYLPRSPAIQEQRPVQRADPYEKFREFIRDKSDDEKQELYNRYRSAYNQALSQRDDARMAYYANLMSILLKSGVELNQ